MKLSQGQVTAKYLMDSKEISRPSDWRKWRTGAITALVNLGISKTVEQWDSRTVGQ